MNGRILLNIAETKARDLIFNTTRPLMSSKHYIKSNRPTPEILSKFKKVTATPAYRIIPDISLLQFDDLHYRFFND